VRKNVASQVIGAQMVSATDGSAFTGSVTVAVTGDGGTQATGSVGSGACTHEGGGYHTYAPAQAETNYNLVAFTFSGTGAVPVTIQVYTESINRHDTVRLGLTALPNAAADAAGGLPISDAGGQGIDVAITQIGAIHGKLPGKDYIAGTDNVDGNIEMTDAIGNFAGSVASVVGAVGSVTGGVTVSTISTDVISAGAVSSAAASKIAAAVDVALINTGDGSDLLQAIANQIAADWVAGDASPLAIVSALTANATFIQLVADASAAATALGTAGNGLSNIPWNASWDAQVESEVTDALTAYDGPTNAEMEARTLAAADYATASNLAATDTVVDATKVIADKLDTMMELDGSVYRLTTNAVEQVAAGSGTADWTADEKTAIRSILGIPGSGTTPADPSSGILDTIRDQTTSAVLEAAARAGVMGTWTDETGASFVLIITG
jgi:hypothetical protein